MTSKNDDVKRDIDNVLQLIRNLSFVSNVKVVGSFAKGKKNYKDVDILIQLKVTDNTLRKNRVPTKRDIVKILRTSKYSNLDLYLHTTDNREWRLRPWVDDSLPKSDRKVTWDWEDWADWPELISKGRAAISTKPRIQRTKELKSTLKPHHPNAITVKSQRKRVPQGVFADKGGTRLSRRHHRGWKRIPQIIA